VDNSVVDLTNSPPKKKSRLDDSTSSLAQPTSSYFATTSSRLPAKSRKSDTQTIDIDSPSLQPGTLFTSITSEDIPVFPTTTLQSYQLPTLKRSQASQSGLAFDRYTMATATSNNDPSLPSSQTRTSAQQKRHEEWQRRLAGGGIIPRRRSLALDEAAAAEARRAIGIKNENDEPDEDEDEGDRVESVGLKLKAKFAAKVDIKAKGKGKKQEEVGPSGQTYTPLEKQFIVIKEANPDVLLMMEGKFYRS
jgi:DNA mismatch repair protein MSH3